MSRSCVILVMCGFCPFADIARGQTTHFVDDDASLGGDGASWNTAYRHLQDALTAASAGDEIHVAGGTYTPDKDETGSVTPGARDAKFQLVNQVRLLGGYRGCPQGNCAGGDPDERNIAAYETILSGDLSGNDQPDFINNAENSYHVVTGSGTDATTVIEGFTVTAGNANGPSVEQLGGGMYNTGGDPTIMNCTFQENVAQRGAGMYNDASSPIIDGCDFVNNRATAGVSISGGAGMFNYDSDPQIMHCTFHGNICTWNRDGGGMQNTRSSPTITDCTFRNNEGDVGGAMFNDDGSNPLIERCNFINNLGPRGGGALGNIYRSCPTIIDCLFHGNLTDGSSYPGGWGGVTMEDPGIDCSASYYNCTFSGNTSSDVGGVVWIATGSAEFINCTFSANAAANDGGAFWILPYAQPILTNCILWGDSPQELAGNPDDPPVITFTDIEGGYAGEGNINSNPRFIDSDGDDNIVGTLDDDLRLSAGSLCIDAGNNLVVPACVRDLDGNFRFMDDPAMPDRGLGSAPIVDMGAYELTGLVSDCNGNGIHDSCDVEEGGYEDCNNNDVPDECDVPPLCGACLDCNSNLIPDECELADNDCNGNSVPDECEVPPLCGSCSDCNSSLIPDECELADNDCDGNGVPDECDPDEDCNGNDVQDICDIAHGTSGDCNSNWIPDDCDIAAGGSNDENGNEVPDDCEALKNRYVSLLTNDETGPTAYRVDMTASAYFPESTGVSGWVDQPNANNVSRVVHDPVYREDWPRVIYVGDCEIVPVATYEFSATTDGSTFFNTFEVATIHKPGPRYYGDIVGVGTGDLLPLPGFTPPNRVVNVTDVQAFVLTFQGASSPSTHPTWVDLHGDGDGCPPNFVVNVSDLQRIKFGFQGQRYDDAPDQWDPADCP